MSRVLCSKSYEKPPGFITVSAHRLLVGFDSPGFGKLTLQSAKPMCWCQLSNYNVPVSGHASLYLLCLFQNQLKKHPKQVTITDQCNYYLNCTSRGINSDKTLIPHFDLNPTTILIFHA